MDHYTQVTAQTTIWPVSLPELKTHLRLSGDELDQDLDLKLRAAVEYCEDRNARVYRHSKTVTQTYSQFPTCFRFDWEPVLAISSITYQPVSGSPVTVASSNYRLVKSNRASSLLEWVDGYNFPDHAYRSDAVVVTYTAGYTDLDTIPAYVKQAIMLKVGMDMDDTDTRTKEQDERAINDLLARHDWGWYR
jgi:uncharacterized phiE125 gp8 family phage protein